MCELHVLTGHKVPILKVNNVTSVLKFSKSYFVWHTQQLVVAVDTTFLDTRSLTTCAKFPSETPN